MGENKSFPKAVLQNTIVAGSLVAAMGTAFHYIPLYDFSWTGVAIFTAIGLFFGFLTGLERVRYYRLQTEKEDMQTAFGQIEFSLKRSTHQFRILLDNLSDAIYQTNEQGKFVYFNQAMILFTGYNAKELRLMRLPNIQLKKTGKENSNAMIMDNNIHRHKETWRHKTGHQLEVEINTRTIQSVNRTYELHVARDISSRGESAKSNTWLQEIQHWHYGRIREESQFRQRLYQQIQDTLNGFSTLVSQYMKEYPGKDQEANKALTDWKRTRNLLQLFISKNNRDKHIRQSYWDLNEVLLQELSYLKTSIDTENISIQVHFGSNLVKTKASGNDLTMGLALILRALCLAIQEGGGGNLQVISNMTADSLYVELHATNAKDFNPHFANALQMTTGTFIVETAKPKDLPELFYSNLNIHFDSLEEKGKTIVKLRFPFEHKSITYPAPPPRKSEPPKNQPPKSNDYVVL